MQMIIPYRPNCKSRNQSRQNALFETGRSLSFSMPAPIIHRHPERLVRQEKAQVRTKVWGKSIATLERAMQLAKRMVIEMPGRGKTPGFDLGS